MQRHHNTTQQSLSARSVPFGAQRAARAAVTLLEMMVAIVVVMLIMLLFAKIFEMVAGTMTAQKGIAENDQKARTFTILLTQDIKNRTFRRVVPFSNRKNTANQPGPLYIPQERRGYFSISENDPDNPTDDVLSFTIEYDVPISMKATLLEPIPLPAIDKNQNQPVFDDGIPDNGAGSSRFAEVVYFLRHGNLYRRVMLIREPYDDEDKGVQPNELEVLNYPYGSGHFWRDFDYSVYRKFRDPKPGPKFHGPDSLNNDSLTPPTIRVDSNNDGKLDTADFVVPESLGIPYLRFGHSPTLGYGVPREFVRDDNGFPVFIGRFVQQETAHSNFGYPGFIPSTGDPFSNFNLTYDVSTGLVVNSNGVNNGLGNQTFRRGEDILLSHVHEFDIKVWDDYDENDNRVRVMDFVNLGHNRRIDGKNIGYYHFSKIRNTKFSPINTNPPRIRYDTWFPFVGPDQNKFGLPPFRPTHLFLGEDGVRGTILDDDLNGRLNDGPETDWLGSDDEVPLKAIQITIRFFDVDSDQMRQLTLVLKLTD